RKVDADPAQRIRAVAVAGAVVALGCVLLGTLSGGRLGDGPFDPVSVPVGVASVVAFCWIVIPGSFVAFFTGEHEPPAPPPEALEENEAFEDADEVDVEEAAEAVEDLEPSEEDEPDEEPGEDASLSRESDAGEEAELSRESDAEPDEAVTGGTETCGDVEPDETDR
ncbi:hypothetical protein GTY80_16145, partial [Amycolatopsis sp. SID8362]|nr:hypothetical protein [Amycolatopsis sp. SID8362]NED41470.1 hypothetical protein [Amycolatopsis sp. SID8362]